MKLHIAIFYLLLNLCSVLAGVNEEFEKSRMKFYGDWKIESNDRITTITWKEDGTWKSRTEESGKLVWSLKGVWWVYDGSLHGVCLKSSDPRIQLGTDQPSEILKISDKEYTIKTSKGELKTYLRNKDSGEQNEAD